MESGPDTVRRYRSAKDWDQTQLAQASGVNLSTLQKAEQGKHRPRRQTVQMLDDALEAHGELLAAFGYQDGPALAHAWEPHAGPDLVTVLDRGANVMEQMERRLAEHDRKLALLLEHFGLEDAPPSSRASSPRRSSGPQN